MTPGPGHNGGPPLDPMPEATWHGYVWRRAHRKAWRTPPREIALRRLERAEALGMTYREYTLELLERGRHPDAIKDGGSAPTPDGRNAPR